MRPLEPGGPGRGSMQDADVLVPTVTDAIDAELIDASRVRDLEADRELRHGRRPYRPRGGARAKREILGHQHAGRPHRGHGGYDNGADPRGAAAARRRRAAGAEPASWSGLGADDDAGAPYLGQAARHHRDGADRPGGRPPGPRLRPLDPLSQPQPAGRPPPKSALEATWWQSLDQMLAHMDFVSIHCPSTPATYHLLLSARRLGAPARRRPTSINTSRGHVDRRGRAGAPAQGAGQDRGRRARRL